MPLIDFYCKCAEWLVQQTSLFCQQLTFYVLHRLPQMRLFQTYFLTWSELVRLRLSGKNADKLKFQIQYATCIPDNYYITYLIKTSSKICIETFSFFPKSSKRTLGVTLPKTPRALNSTEMVHRSILINYLACKRNLSLKLTRFSSKT